MLYRFFDRILAATEAHTALASRIRGPPIVIFTRKRLSCFGEEVVASGGAITTGFSNFPSLSSPQEGKLKITPRKGWRRTCVAVIDHAAGAFQTFIKS